MFLTPWLSTLSRSFSFSNASQPRRTRRIRNRQQHVSFVAEQLEDRTLLATWVAQGPAPTVNGQTENLQPNDEVSGALHTVVAHPTDPNILFVGGTNSGIWRTTDAQSVRPTWEPLTDGMESLSIGAMAMDPTDPNVIVAGTGRYSSFGRTGGALAGLLVTRDGGDTWEHMATGELAGRNISGVTVRGNTILVSTNSFGGGVGPGLYRSTDGGNSFTFVSGTSGLATGSIFDLVSDPSNSTRYYASVGGVGIYRSDDAGTTWSNVSSSNGPLNNVITVTGAGGANNNLEMAVASNGRLYAIVVINGQPAYIGFTDNQGSIWNAMDLPQTPEGNGDVEGLSPRAKPGAQGATHLSVAVDPSDPNIVYVGGDRQDTPFPNYIGANDFSARLFRGDTTILPTGAVPSPQWEHLTHSNNVAGIPGGGTASNSAPHADSREITFDALGNLIEVDDGGVYLRTSPQDNTGDWYSIIGNIQGYELHDLAYDPISNVLIGGAQDAGTPYQVAPNSPLWVSLTTGDGGDVSVDSITLAAQNQSIRYTSFQNLGNFLRTVWDSNNNLVSFNYPALNVTTGAAVVPQFVTPVELNAIDPTRLIIGGANSTYESQDSGETLVEIGAGVSVNGSIFGNALAYGGTSGGTDNEDVLYVGSGGEVYVRTTSGGTLAATAAAFPGGFVRDIVIDPEDWMTAYVIDSNQVFETTDAGASWTEITGNLVDDTLQTIEFIAGASGGIDNIVVGGRSGVMRMNTLIPGEWSEFADGLPHTLVWDLDYNASDDILAVGTLGRGAWTVQGAASQQRAGTITFDKAAYEVNDLVTITVDDPDLVGSGTITVVVNSDLGDTETVTLAEIPGGRFQGSISSQSPGAATVGNGFLEFALGDQIDATYNDNNDGSGSLATVVDVADVVAYFQLINADFHSGVNINIQSNDFFTTTGSANQWHLTNSRGSDPGHTSDWSFYFGAGEGVGGGGSYANNANGTLLSPLIDLAGVGDYVELSFNHFLSVESGFDIATLNAIDEATGATTRLGSYANTSGFENVTLNVSELAGTRFRLAFTMVSDFINVDEGWFVDDVILTAPVQLSIDDITLDEGVAGTTDFEFTVMLSSPILQPVTVEYATSDVSAISPDDYNAASGLLTFIPGETQQTVTITFSDDAIDELDEEFYVNLFNPTNASLSKRIGVGTILDNDLPPNLTLNLTGSPIAENGGMATVTAQLDQISGLDVTVDLAFSGVAAMGADYSVSGTSIVIPAGSMSQSVTITAIDDALDEIDEDIIVSVTNVTNATNLASQRMAVITDDDLPPEVNLQINNGTIRETGGVAIVGVVLSAPSGRDITVDLGFSGAAIAGTDYLISNTQVVIPAGVMQGAITLTGIDDALDEDDESIVVDIVGVVNATVGTNAQVMGVITDNDSGPAVSLSLSNNPFSEAGGVAIVTATLSQPSAKVVSVNFAFSGTATNLADYQRSGSVLSILPGNTTGTITLTGVDDVIDEVDETVIVEIVSVTDGSELGEQQVVATIIDDDVVPAVTLSIAGGPIAENGGVLTVTATLDVVSSRDVTINLGFSGTSNSADYDDSSDRIMIPAGSLSGAITITGVDDNTDEDDETIVVEITGLVNAREATKQQVTATIIDDDSTTISINDVVVTESDLGTTLVTFSISLSSLSSRPVTVEFATADGTATAGIDYGPNGGSRTFPAGVSVQTLTIPIFGDTSREPDETFFVNLTNATNATIVDDQGVATIIDNDANAPLPTLSINDVSVIEGNSGVSTAEFTISLSAISSTEVRFDVTTLNGSARAGSDFTDVNEALTLPPGQLSRTLRISVLGDLRDEPDENFFVNLINPINAILADGQGEATIIDDDDPAPGQPTLIDPIGEIDDPTPTFTWTPVAGAVRYELQVDNLTTGEAQVILESNITETSFTPTRDLLVSSYRFWVRAFNAQGQAGSFSSPNQFTLLGDPIPLPQPARPTLTSPNGSSTETLPTFAWNSVTGGVRYDLWVDNETLNQTEIIRQQNLTSINYTAQTALPPGVYRAWVRAFNSQDVPGNWSQVHFFTITEPAPLAARPTVIAPALSTTDRTPTISWNRAANASYYDVWVNDVTRNQAQVIRQTFVVGTSITPATDLPLGRFRVWVRAFNSEGVPGNWSAPFDFTVASGQPIPAKPSITSPTGTIANATPTFSWNAVANAVRYDLWVDNRMTGQSEVIRQQNLTTNSFTPAAPLPNGDYRVWVRAFNPAGEAGNWSNIGDFSILIVEPRPVAPTLFGPAGNTFETQPTLAWQAIPNAVRYDLWVNNDTTGQTQVIRQPNLTTTTFTPTSELPRGTYTFWVRGINIDGLPGNWSNPLTFNVTIDFPVPATPTILSPVDGSTTSTHPSFTWELIPGAVSYDLWVDNTMTGEEQFIRLPNLTENHFHPTTPVPAGTYSVWVRAMNEEGEFSPWSVPTNFTVGTVAPLPGRPVVSAPVGLINDSTPTFRWQSTDADSYELWVANRTAGISEFIRVFDLTTTSFTPSTPLPAGEYIVWVRAFNSQGGASSWSLARFFQVSQNAVDSAFSNPASLLSALD